MSLEDQAYLDSIYEDLDRQSIPSSYDARSKCMQYHILLFSRVFNNKTNHLGII